jgi:hypothetical protein
VVPPLVQHAFANELEPWCEFKRRILEHVPEVFLGDKSRITSFVWVNVEINVGLDEEDIVDYESISKLAKGIGTALPVID